MEKFAGVYVEVATDALVCLALGLGTPAPLPTPSPFPLAAPQASVSAPLAPLALGPTAPCEGVCGGLQLPAPATRYPRPAPPSTAPRAPRHAAAPVSPAPRRAGLTSAGRGTVGQQARERGFRACCLVPWGSVGWLGGFHDTRRLDGSLGWLGGFPAIPAIPWLGGFPASIESPGARARQMRMKPARLLTKAVDAAPQARSRRTLTASSAPCTSSPPRAQLRPMARAPLLRRVRPCGGAVPLARSDGGSDEGGSREGRRGRYSLGCKEANPRLQRGCKDPAKRPLSLGCKEG